MKRKFLLLLTLGMGPLACEVRTDAVQKDEINHSLPAGTYVSQTCFLNKLATQDPAVPVYTRGTLSFDARGVGTSSHKLYLDEACADPADQEGSLNIVLSYVGELGEVSLYRIVQEDPNLDDDEPMTFWFTAVQDGEDFIADMEFRNGESGPYLSRPTQSQVADFAADPEGTGVRFIAQ